MIITGIGILQITESIIITKEWEIPIYKAAVDRTVALKYNLTGLTTRCKEIYDIIVTTNTQETVVQIVISHVTRTSQVRYHKRYQ